MTEHLAQMMLVQILRLYQSSLGEMAGVASQLRSTFALHCKQRVGIAPQEYLTRWRMHPPHHRSQGSQ